MLPRFTDSPRKRRSLREDGSVVCRGKELGEKAGGNESLTRQVPDLGILGVLGEGEEVREERWFGSSCILT